MSNKPRMNTVHISKLSLLKSPNNTEDFDKRMLANDAMAQQQTGTQPNLQLIPVKIDIELEGRRYKDMFLWDKNEPYQTIDSFVKILIEEQNLPAVFESELISNIRKQVNQFRQYKQMEGELVKVVQINVRIGNIVLRDQFEWDINNPHNSPEDFAESLVQDLGLGPEFMLPVAHQIREQINEHQRIAQQERRGGYVGYSALGRDFKGNFNKGVGEFDKNNPGKSLHLINDERGQPIVAEQDVNNPENQAF
jgi:hypothetical protein